MPPLNLFIAEDVAQSGLLQPEAGKACTPSQLRRTLASVLVANGNNIRLVQELLRHSSPLITLDVYACSTTPARIEAQGQVMQQLLTEDSKAALAAAQPASTGTM